MTRRAQQIDEALNLLQEECAEIIQIISKIRRFGFDSYHPDDETKRSNLSLLHDEIGDFDTIKNYLIESDIIDSDQLITRTEFKNFKLRKYTNLFS